VAGLEREVSELRSRVASLELRGAAATQVLNVQLGPGASASAEASGSPPPRSPSPPAAEEEAAPPSSPAPSLPRPTRSAPRAAAGSLIKHYVVLEPNAFGEPGTYCACQAFADAVRDASVPWSGRGKFPWAAGANGVACSSLAEAEAEFRSQKRLPEGTPVPHWG
jgi:hypothetical protein